MNKFPTLPDSNSSKNCLPSRYHMITGHLLPVRRIGYLPHRKFHNAVVEISKILKVPYDMALIVALSSIALCCQGFSQVEKPRGGFSPLSLLVIVLASSGSRKSPLVKILFGHLYAFQADLLKQYKIDLRKHMVKHQYWEQVRKAILADIMKESKDGGDTDHLEIRHQNHMEEEPVAPIRPKYIYEDITGPGLWNSLRNQMTSAGVITSEASASLEKWMQQDLCHFNTAHDGDAIDIVRAGTGSFELLVRLTFLLMLQPELFDKHMKGRGKDLRSLGMFARYLVCRPESVAGSRFDDGADQSWLHVSVFKKRQIELMKRSCSAVINGDDLQTAKFDAGAKGRWFEIANWLEEQQRGEGYFSGVKDHASKEMDLISRVAALFHVFEGYDGDISVETLESAKEVCLYFADYYCSQFSHPPEHVSDAIKLNTHFDASYRAKGCNWMSKNEVRNYAPGRELRKKERFDLACMELCKSGVIREMRQYNRGRKEAVFLVFNPQTMPQPPMGYYFPIV